MIKNKKILIGVSGSISAYKIPLLVRLLKKSGAEVKVVLTPFAKQFVTPLTLSTVSENPVPTELVLNEEGEWTNHVDLGLWADLMVIAPATANTLAKMNQGICDNLLLAVYLSAKCPVMFAPAMDLDMYKHQATRMNMEALQARGNILIPAESGALASGLEGEGRLAEPEEIFNRIQHFFATPQPLAGIKVLVTAGPTQEAIDPVRYISNRSSGLMGFALAESLAASGAEVMLIKGPTTAPLHHLLNNDQINIIEVTSADEMYEAALKFWPQCQIGILAAAVADYKPAQTSKQKIKKTDDSFVLEMVKNRDILATIGANKTDEQFLVGFALETENEMENAKQKLNKKNLDLIVMNSLQDQGAGFGVTTNKVTLVDKDNSIYNLPLMSKSDTAIKIVEYISQKINNQPITVS